MVAVVAVSVGTTAVSPRSAGASSLTNDRTKAATLLSQINRINGQVELLGQKYDKAQINLRRLNNEITNTKAVVASIEGNVAKGNSQLRTDVIFAYVTNGSNQGNNPLFSKNASKTGATTVYIQLAEGN